MRSRLVITAGESRWRLDRVLASRFPDRSRSYLKRLIQEGHVTLPGRPDASVSAARPMTAGDVVAVVFPKPRPLALQPEATPLSILHEDERILVVDKPAGMTVHPGAGAAAGTLVHALLHHCRDLSGIGGVERPGIVHRLDKPTSGVLVVAKDDAAHRCLARQFEERTVVKVYEALVWGRPRLKVGTIEVPIGRDAHQRVKISPRTSSPREALTRYRVVAELGRFARLEVTPRTGRTHQIRVHLKLLGHPVVGDDVYGGAGWSRAPADRREALARFGRLALHALRLTIEHPSTGSPMTFEAPLPDDFQALLEALRE